ncbi:TadE/TadG family type IV pilus assembly protein [Oceanicella actignis]|uniref:Flp pilus assembly protein TadG n=1 Tax=Oceanicella actignis TaxID=1189325 RepID=A0A1M7TYK7_9RHOB|nr:TadE/TadG family type IV pilus assembly protein [Oceanicella actignis]SET81923.1 Flp pilus assembly protein TadG [Oceanicella actignis]SHN75767.1 Flp pilus assembly protein TadG [Oceanicella actignis]
MNGMLKRLSRRRAEFARDESGAITALMVLLFLGIIVATGAAIDIARQEAERADLQAALDRGVLAATSLNQEVPKEELDELIDEYVELRNLKKTDATVTVDPKISINERDVAAKAYFPVNTTFLRFVGLSDMMVGADSRAVQSVTNVEISLVLDISGSMRFDERVLDLIPAAQNFINVVTQSGANRNVTVNLIRYAGQTNPGPWMFEKLGGKKDAVWSHDNSHCFYMDTSSDGDFSHADLPRRQDRQQVPHFMYWAIAKDWMKWGWCPSDEMQIRYLVNDYATLVNEIDKIRPGGKNGDEGNLHDGTGTYNAMKWAVALLNPSSQGIVHQMVLDGLVDPAYDGRPAAWNAEDTKKFIVLMTDGKITEQYDPREKNDKAKVELMAEKAVLETDQLSADRLFGRSTGVSYFYNQCQLAKDHGVTVFTIAFMTPYKDEMENCASTKAHFYEADQLNIGQVFSHIATTIQRLRLIM